WHKDVKPDNIIVDAKSAHLVDFGLITPLRSAMTLTTHGTEYFRDPEMVRMALRGAKVHEVNGAKFDIYAAGAVLYAVIENSFPAHGALSQFSKPCPDALRWIIRRAMTDYDKRYASASEMLADLRHALACGNINALRPAELPSVRGGVSESIPEVPVAEPIEIIDEAVVNTPPAPRPAPAAARRAAPALPAQQRGPQRPRIRVINWWTGQWKAEGPAIDTQPVRVARAGSPSIPKPQGVAFAAAAGRPTAFGKRMAAREQVRTARKRAARARKNAATRIQQRRMKDRYNNNLNWGTFLALLCAVGFAGGIVLALTKQNPSVTVLAYDDQAPVAPAPQLPQRPQGPAVITSNPFAAGDAVEVVNIDEIETFDSLEGTTILFLSDLLPPLRADLADQLESAEAVLSHSGTTTISALTADDEALDEGSLEALAEVNHRRGQLPLDARKTSKALNEWLEQQHSIDAIAWLGTDEMLYVFAPGFRDSGSVCEAPQMLSDALVKRRH
ncbi:MAG: hypothetical protein KDB18_13310, partial [Salinibacterium sp.]|nr:hypothetical protein [Salinibacterium sp.]